jgi:hypothetical protein
LGALVVEEAEEEAVGEEEMRAAELASLDGMAGVRRGREATTGRAMARRAPSARDMPGRSIGVAEGCRGEKRWRVKREEGRVR